MTTYRFDPVDVQHMRLLGRLSPGGRIRAMLDACRAESAQIVPSERDPDLGLFLDESFGDAQARALGADASELWEHAKAAALQEARRA